MRNILLLLILLAVSCGSAVIWSPPGAAQQIRFLPDNGKRGTTGGRLQMPLVAIGRETRKLAPGGLIFDTNNRTILHGSLPAGADVWYQVNNSGQFQRIYILRPEEQARLDKAGK
jgi:hypothetical protein